ICTENLVIPMHRRRVMQRRIEIQVLLRQLTHGCWSTRSNGETEWIVSVCALLIIEDIKIFNKTVIDNYTVELTFSKRNAAFFAKTRHRQTITRISSHQQISLDEIEMHHIFYMMEIAHCFRNVLDEPNEKHRI